LVTKTRTITKQVDEFTIDSRLVSLDLFAHHNKTALRFPIPKFETEFAYRVDGINGLPLAT
jgi:hypothetical protein